MPVHLRPGTLDDESPLLNLFDEAVLWLTQRGLSGQWGSEPWSQRPETRERVARLARSPGLTVAEKDGDVVGALEVSESFALLRSSERRTQSVHLSPFDIEIIYRARDRHRTLGSCTRLTAAREASAFCESIAGQAGNNNSSGTTSQLGLLPRGLSIEMDGRDSFLASALIDQPSPRLPRFAQSTLNAREVRTRPTGCRPKQRAAAGPASPACELPPTAGR